MRQLRTIGNTAGAESDMHSAIYYGRFTAKDTEFCEYFFLALLLNAVLHLGPVKQFAETG
jgi:hypothetical protein